MSTAAAAGLARSRLRPLAEHPRLAFTLRRGTRFIASLAVLVTAAFAMIHLVPGDPVRDLLGASATQAQVDQTRALLGLDRSLPGQYLHYLGGLLSGNFGTSISEREPVRAVLGQRFPATLSLAGLAIAATIGVGVPAGLAAGVFAREHRHRRTDLAFVSATSLLSVLPEFLLAVALVYVLGVSLHGLPVAGRGAADSYLLPVISLAAAPTAMIARLVRVETMRSLQEDYVRTARSKQLPPLTIYLRHVLPNAATAALTTAGLLFGGLIAGTVVVENVFAWPGIGATMVSSITGKDYSLVQGIVLVYGALILTVNLLVDVALAAIDPRSRIAER
jgi:peptide/nickel transport system permease protein